MEEMKIEASLYSRCANLTQHLSAADKQRHQQKRQVLKGYLDDFKFPNFKMESLFLVCTLHGKRTGTCLQHWIQFTNMKNRVLW